jgi:dTMP kinase
VAKVRRRHTRLPIALDDDERRTLEEVVRAHVLAVLKASRNNRTNAARLLGVDRKTLSRSLVRWGISLPREPRGLQAGSLIAIEGIDGAGLTTQARLLADLLNARGHRALLTGEPSSGPVGQLLRRVLATPSALRYDGALRTLSMLFATDRVDHLQRVVAPALEAATTVVSDRWYHSSLAYQRTGVDREWIRAMNRHTRTPNVAFVLDVRPEIAAQRRLAAGRPIEYFHDPATQRDVVAGYRATIAELRAEGERIEVIDGEQSIDDVAAAIRRALRL